ncbi:MAG TPA: UDP-N-acetylmuramoyl-tripeptide--D-alanyl-D-alanine ligase [Terriglobia bacterium]|nr:UDP-N-acetylmuramoyl-tripeptide--D-alanyl-D-alanine ligase [Terriglobia bacterium]
MQLSTTEIASILDSRWEGTPRLASGYSIDSRSVQPGDLFFAIQGPRNDGHGFIGQAFGSGAIAAIVRGSYHPADAPSWQPFLISVPDTTLALQTLAHAVRRKWPGRLIGITGSAGKTTVKEMTAALLERRFRVLKSSGNLNNHYGVPLTLLRLEPSDDAAVVEMAMSGPGEIARLASWAEPGIGVVTNVSAAHLAFFDSVDSIARAKRELIESLPPTGIAVLNQDDERVRGFAAGFRGRVVTFGFTEGADYRALGVRAASRNGTEGSEFELRGGTYSGSFFVPLPGRHNAENALAAIAAASLFDLRLEDVREGLAHFRAPGQRTEIIRLPGGVVLINDVYNSNPRAMERMLETLACWPHAKRRIVIAGEMLELGPSAPDWHRRVGRECAQAGIDWLLAVQGDARFFLEGAEEAGLPGDKCSFFATAEEAGRFCLGIVEPGDVILVKGSRGVHLERATEILRIA